MPQATSTASPVRTWPDRRLSHAGDEDLISLVRSGDAAAFAELHDRHGGAAYRYSYKMMGNKQDAEDLAQDAFLQVWRSAASYRPERGSMRTWIFAIVRNRGIDRLRSDASRRRSRPKAVSWQPDPEPGGASVWQEERRDRVRGALKDLPRAQLEVLALLHYRGLTHAEASERLGLPLGTVKGRARLGLKKLRAHPELRGMTVG